MNTDRDTRTPLADSMILERITTGPFVGQYRMTVTLDQPLPGVNLPPLVCRLSADGLRHLGGLLLAEMQSAGLTPVPPCAPARH